LRIGYAGGTNNPADLKLQLERLVELGCDHIFSDEGFVAGDRMGTGLERALAHTTTGDVLIVAGLVCLGPSLRDVAGVVDALQRVDAHLKVLRDGIDTSRGEGAQILRTIQCCYELMRGEATRRRRLSVERGKGSGRIAAPPRKLTGEQEDYVRCEIDSGRKTVAALARELKVGQKTIYMTLARDPYAQDGVYSEDHTGNLPQPIRALTPDEESYAVAAVRGGRGAQELADELGVSRRTIYRAIDRA
jgi:DNA invertase Pin-like site-specific DNA recombinase